MAPPAAPTAAPTTAPTAASFTTSAVLSRSPVCEAAYRLQASTAACGGIVVDGWATRGAGALAVPVLTAALVSSPTRLATTSPVTSAVAIINAIAIAVTFHGSQLPFITCLLPGRRTPHSGSDRRSSRTRGRDLGRSSYPSCRNPFREDASDDECSVYMIPAPPDTPAPLACSAHARSGCLEIR